jgi:GNAT superfamily N-acetyltransferase
VPAEDQPLFALRRVTEEDWTLWRDVRLRALADAPDAFGSTLGYWQGDGDREERWRSRLADVPFNVVAIAGDSLIAQVSGTFADPQATVELISMWVDPAARGTGVGEALVAKVVEWARTSGAVALVLSVKTTNSHAASLYRRMGFAPTDEPADEGEARMQLTLD